MTTLDASTAPVKRTPSGFTPVKRSRKIGDKGAAVLVTAAVVIAMIPLIWLLWTLVSRGFEAIIDPSWWQKSELRGGALNAIIGTLQQTAIAAVIAIPIGIFVAIYLVEYGNNSKLQKITTFMVDILSGVPSIVAALFIYAVWRTTFDLPRSGFVVSLALVLLMAPIVVRSTEEMLKIVPQDLREASYALGVPKWKTIVRIVLPTALSGIITGVMLAIARVMGESAPVLILVGSTKVLNSNPFEGNQQSLPLMMVQQYNNGPGAFDTVWGAALTLVILVAIVYFGAKVVSKVFSPKKF
ncbi:MAG: phosphate ABC transporter, permease protein PstA [Gordonia sp.]|jgi:phosphate transport system permease protein|uniref:Phosphate transport system permease protein PstA n=1 Tax=Gordonia rubripertincta TaxID=36822 RepID=A0ABT4N4F0_GORRU|nr:MULTISPECIES: phosphate ABC transporter permease PstA [Mycobacteriales]MBA4026200.1 phosphate ABC transporter, permease protein PstA [Gordonia sp. (in: high G+C Gram-positive bacteria)]MCZ4553196.1 phosphate ABC transporter permease PstA [Gordonia rubripertincta]OZG27659.1 phosphate ABC transporter, permease protein PstA [Williamsia sp. 1138]